ncbi:hypothetical protein [Saccharomonospora iraqiensis]|uniref:hypothetical protein n=1 Tax=Saccharomonospora iraqiensis TaxID=52698 RepID=UPI00022DECDD|nr:hypothetical protein [Saccharomonospora iraqiensis]
MRSDSQDKKALSYARDRRNDYGENDKSSRKNIRRFKRRTHRTARRRDKQVLGSATGRPTGEDVDETGVGLRSQTVRQARKVPDAPLGETIVGKLRRRAERGMNDPALVERAVDRIHRRT